MGPKKAAGRKAVAPADDDDLNTPKRRKGGAAASAQTPENVLKALADSPQIMNEKSDHTYITKILEYYTACIGDTSDTVANFLAATYSTDKLKSEFASYIDESFPPEDGISYATDYHVGPVYGRPWMMNWHEMAGNKGLVLKDCQKSLLTLILALGFRSDPDKYVGVEKLYWGPPVPELFEHPQSYPALHADLLPIFQAHSTKGWTRSITLMFALHAIHKLDLLESVRANTAIFNSFRTLYIVIADTTSELARMESSYSATMASTLTRTRPNAFNHLHHVLKKQKLGSTPESALNMHQQSQLIQVLGIGRFEAKAVMNLIKINDSLRRTLAAAAATYGVHSGPLNHAALASDALLDTYQPDMPVPTFKAKMKSTPSTAFLLGQRVVADYVDSPPQLRRTMNNDGVITLQKISRAFELALDEFAGHVSDKVFKVEEVSLRKAFMHKFMDDALLLKVDSCEDPFDLMTIPEFRTILVRVRSHQQQVRSHTCLHLFMGSILTGGSPPFFDPPSLLSIMCSTVNNRTRHAMNFELHSGPRYLYTCIFSSLLLHPLHQWVCEHCCF